MGNQRPGFGREGPLKACVTTPRAACWRSMGRDLRMGLPVKNAGSFPLWPPACSWRRRELRSVERRAHFGDFHLQTHPPIPLLTWETTALISALSRTQRKEPSNPNQLAWFSRGGIGYPSPQRVRIWFIGGSTTFDIYAPTDHETGLPLLEACWMHICPTSCRGHQRRVPGEDSRQPAGFRATPEVRPDVLVLHAGPNDLRMAANSSDSARGTSQRQSPDGCTGPPSRWFKTTPTRSCSRILEEPLH